ncbi:GABA-specific permease [Wickerhamomyces ciferrii]|uniref:GABA-specific permease n=1 Tax=Wickerhamomyces ciferrii (strain ATCC 14091 / BCRC 22168 / CBS 111 / JCM 3599 / NBRC 0793 / NRRL Y-1031 F-60-10) TaxID=1206466 RepID=K0KXG5_WICCF|nr:GABA-specific permease [Wickerhamomyces ciferrii]CCH45753.1 GABA-specific permease [Wickerhamomyces ciferrii]
MTTDPEKTGYEVHETHTAHMRTITSKTVGQVNYINAREVTNAEDLLAEIGYKQELRRTYSTLQVFGIVFSIQGLLPSIATTMSTGLTVGTVSMIWGWFLAGFPIMGVGIAIAELASAIPTSGGLYYWTYQYAPVGWKAILSFIVGVTNSMDLCAGVCSITYGFAEQILATVYIAHDGDFKITRPIVYGVYAAGLFLQLFLAGISSANASRLQNLSIAANVGVVILFVIALPIVTHNTSTFNDSKFIFTSSPNFSDWPAGWSFLQFGLMPAVWTIGAFDSTVHMSEESKTPSRSIPIAIIGSIAACWIGGFLLTILIAACMPTDISSIISTESGQPLVEIIFKIMGKKWAITFSSLFAFCQLLMSTNILTAISRQIWAFARDDGLPFSPWIKIVHKKLKVPINAIIISDFIALLLGLLILAGPVASNALFSIGVIGCYVAYAIPQFLRLTSGRHIFNPGSFYTGKILSPIIHIVTIIYQIIICLLEMFPETRSVEGATTMNYSVVINCGIWILSLIYYYAFKRNIYNGPKSNLNDGEQDKINSSSTSIDEVIPPSKTGTF